MVSMWDWMEAQEAMMSAGEEAWPVGEMMNLSEVSSEDAPTTDVEGVEERKEGGRVEGSGL